MKDEHQQQPLLGVVRDGIDLASLEQEAMGLAAGALRDIAVSLPPDSQLRALLLRSSARYASAANRGASVSHLRLAQQVG